MEANNGGTNGFGHQKHSVIVSDQHPLKRETGKHHSGIMDLNRSFDHTEELDDKAVAKSLSELDPDILAAMENLSIWDDDAKSSSSGERHEQLNDADNGKDRFIFWWMFDFWNYLNRALGWNVAEENEAIKEIGPYTDAQFTKAIADELFWELRDNQDLDDAYDKIQKAVEFVKSNRIYQ